VPSYLSAAWLQAFAEALAREPLPEPAEGCRVRQVVVDGPRGDVRYDVGWDGERLGVDLEPGDGPADLVVTVDYQTAAAIAQGRMSAQEGIATGRITLRGSLQHVRAARALLGAIEDRVADLRAATTYDPGP
jgi:hypothetical protein